MKPINQESAVVLLIIDVQKGLFEKSTPIYRADQLIENVNYLITKAHQAGAPVFFIQHSSEAVLKKGSEEWQLHPQIQPIAGDVIVHKLHGNAFEETNLREELTKRNVKTVVVAGLVTHGCVKATCSGAIAEEFKVVLVSDGHSSYSKDAAQMIEKWNRELGGQGVDVMETRRISFSS